MWKKAKRIVSCILALVLLLSLMDGQQFFVRAESGVEETQTREAGNKTMGTETSSSKEEKESKDIKDNNKEEEKKEMQKEASTTKATEEITETKREDGKLDKPEKDSENTSEEANTKKENKEEMDSSEDDQAEEDTTQDTDTSDTEKKMEGEEESTEGTETTEAATEIATTTEKIETAARVDETKEKNATNKIKEYIPKEQPEEIQVKAYAEEGVFPEETIMKVRKINKEEKKQVDSALKKEIEYDGFLGYDISFYSKEGKEIEPEEGSVKVSMQLKEDAFAEEADKATLAVQHLEDANKTLRVQQVASAESGTVEVQSKAVSAEYTVSSFSVFTITWKNSSVSAESLTATCIDTDGKEVKIQYDGQTASGTISGSSVTYDANKENITEVSDVSTLAPTVQDATFLKAVIASRQSAANQNGTEISYIRLESGKWQYSSDKNTWENIGDNKLYYIYSKNTITDSKDSISFAYYSLDEINDKHSIAARDTVKFTISLVDQNGKNETYELPAGSVIPDKYTFHSSSVDMNAASFAQMGITIPGYTYEGGYAYFYWYGNFAGEKFSVSNFKNLGANSSKYGKNADSHYDSYIGYTGVHPSKKTAAYDDYHEEVFGKEGYNYYAYNPTGTLRIVFKKVSQTVAFKSHFVDAYKNEAYSLIDTKEMEMHQKGSSTEYYGTLKEITDAVPERDGYTFDGWYMEKDEEGNGTGKKIENISDDTTQYEQDAYYYAKWIPKTYSFSVKKIVDMSGENNMGDKNKEFTFRLSLKNGSSAYDKEIEGLTKTGEEGVYSFTLKHDQTMTASLPDKIAYEITEDVDDYTVQIEAPSDAQTDLDKKMVKGTVNAEKNIVFTNKKTVIPPTGVNNTMTAWILMTGATLLLGAIFFVFDIRRKKLMV